MGQQVPMQLDTSVVIAFAIVSTIVDCIALLAWVREIAVRRSRWPLVAYTILLVVLTAVAVTAVRENLQMRATREEAATLVHSWPRTEQLASYSKGDRIGIVLSGLAFLEKHRAEFPETYRTATQLVAIRLNNFQPPTTQQQSYDEYALTEDVAGAFVRMIGTIAE